MLAAPAGDAATAVRLRLGAPILDKPAVCACCGGELDRQCRHALRCAPGASTHGHNQVRDALLGLAALADGSAAVEPPGLVPSRPTLRPADLLTTAAFGRLAALDVGVTCPDSAGSGSDACVAMHASKLHEYAGVLEELAEEGVQYRPLVWSCWGRPYSDAAAAVRSMATAASRRRGLGDPRGLAGRASALVGVQLWRRAAAMVAACVPATASRDLGGVLATARAQRLGELGLGTPAAAAAA